MAELRLAMLRETVIDNPYIPKELNGHSFPSVPQADFLTLPVDELLYGGAAGGGKSAALLAAALQFVSVPNYSAILFRRTFADLSLPGALIPMSHEWLGGTDAKYDGQLHQWTFSNGATVAFGYLDNEQDHQRYKGSAFQFLGFDELTDILEFQYRFMQSRLRKPEDMNVPIRSRAASNPGGRGHEWVKQRFIDAKNALYRMFVPAKLEDNPGLDQVAYDRALSLLDPITRAQMRHGDWDVRPEGGLFKRAWFEKKTIARAPNLIRAVRYWDIAATPVGENGNMDPDWTAGVLVGITDDKQYVILDVKRTRGSALDVKRLIRTTAERDGREIEVCVEQEGGASGKIVAQDIVRETLTGFTAYAIKPRGSKVERSKPFQAAAERGNVWLLAGEWIGEYLNELCAFGTGTAHDDQVDGSTGSIERLTGGAKQFDQEKWAAMFSKKPEDPRMIAALTGRFR